MIQVLDIKILIHFIVHVLDVCYFFTEKELIYTTFDNRKSCNNLHDDYRILVVQTVTLHT